jgi:hypothetical protein
MLNPQNWQSTTFRLTIGLADVFKQQRHAVTLWKKIPVHQVTCERGM